MKKILFLALSLTASFSAFARDVAPQTDVVHYKYGMHLDVAKVIHITEAAPTCAPTPVQMTYQDSQRQTHTLEYSIIGGGCFN